MVKQRWWFLLVLHCHQWCIACPYAPWCWFFTCITEPCWGWMMERERETGCSSWNPVPQCIRHLSATRMTAFTHGLIHSMEVALWDLSSKPGWSVRFRVSRYANSTRTFTSRYIEYVWFVYIRWGTMKLVDRWMDGYLRIHIRWVKCWPYRIPRMYPSHKGKLSSSGFHDGRSDGAAWRWVFGSSKLQC